MASRDPSVGAVALGLAFGLGLVAAGCTEAARPGAADRAPLGQPDAAPPPLPPRDAGGPVPDAGPARTDAGGVVSAADLGPADAGSPDAGPVGPVSPRLLQFKKFDQIEHGLARILDLELDEVCVELGRYPCTREAHRVVLGGSKGHLANIYTGDPDPGPTTPLAAERVVLAACGLRVERDRGLKADAILADADRVHAFEDAEPGLERLYHRALLRPITERERAAFSAAFDDAADADTFLRAACAGVLTATEFLLY